MRLILGHWMTWSALSLALLYAALAWPGAAIVLGPAAVVSAYVGLIRQAIEQERLQQ